MTRVKILTLCGLLVSGSAGAVALDGWEIPYAGIGVLQSFADSNRDVDDGLGGRFSFGWPLPRRNHAIEFNVFGAEHERVLDGNPDFVRGLMIDYVIGMPIGGGNSPIKALALGGIGLLEDDVRGERELDLGAELGLGVLFPVGSEGIAIRLDARSLMDFNDVPANGDSSAQDYNVMLGLQIPLTRWFDAPGSTRAEDECGVAVVGSRGRDGCEIDSDNDGVLDDRDRCPDTPAGAEVDETGCQPSAGDEDNDNDGVNDLDDLCPGTYPGADVDETGCVKAVDAVVLEGVNFKLDSAELTADSSTVLDAAAEILKSQARIKVEVAGHTDKTGTAAYNQDLSLRRADAVVRYLISAGVESSRMMARGYGHYEPLADNESKAGRAKNRRVEFRIIYE